MKRQVEIGVLVLLLVGLLLAVYFKYVQDEVTPMTTLAYVSYSPMGVQDPALRFDLLQKIRGFEYAGRHRNIFSMSLPQPEKPKDAARVPVPQLPPPPTLPPPLVVPVKFFGISSDPKTGGKRAMFTDGDDVYILSEGETLLHRFRLLHIGNSSAEFEEISTQRRATLPLEEVPNA